MRETTTIPPDAALGLRVGLVVSRYHESITGALREGAVAAFIAAGGEMVNIVELIAPGAFELPQIAMTLARSQRVEAIVTLGCVIRGETSHFDFICSAVAQGLMNVGRETGIPTTFGVLTCDTLEQAQARAGGRHGNKGEEAMSAALMCRHVQRQARWTPEAATP